MGGTHEDLPWLFGQGAATTREWKSPMMDAGAMPVPGLPKRFRVDGPLGHGGQAQTLAATDTRSGDAVVVKVFRLAGSEAWKRFELFERECTVLRSLQHPSIPRYVDHGGDEDAGVFYLVMKRAGGESLQSKIDRGTRFTDAQLSSMLEGLLDVLEYLHGLNPPVIHRDLKPGNVVVAQDGHVSLVDFGSVRDVLVDARQSTVVGTYGYMAPEQLRGQSSPASDLYGLGATLAAAATGADAANLPTKGLEVDLAGVMNPGGLRGQLQWMLRPDPLQRPATVAEVRGRVGAAPQDAEDTVGQMVPVQSRELTGAEVRAVRRFGDRELNIILGVSAAVVAWGVAATTGSLLGGLVAAVVLVGVTVARGMARDQEN